MSHEIHDRLVYWSLLIIKPYLSFSIDVLFFFSLYVLKMQEKNQYSRNLAMKMAFVLVLVVLLLCRAKKALLYQPCEKFGHC